MRTTKLIRFSKLIATPRRWLKTSAAPRATACRAVARTVASGLRDGSPAGGSTLPQPFTSPLARDNRRPLPPAKPPRPSDKTPVSGVATVLDTSRNRPLGADETLRAPLGKQGCLGSRQLRHGTELLSPPTPGWPGSRRQQDPACLCTQLIRGGADLFLTLNSRQRARNHYPRQANAKLARNEHRRPPQPASERTNNACICY